MKKYINFSVLIFYNIKTQETYYHYNMFSSIQPPATKKNWIIKTFFNVRINSVDALTLLDYVDAKLSFSNVKIINFYNYKLHNVLYNIRDFMKELNIKEHKEPKEPSMEEIAAVGLGHCLWD